MSYSLKIIDARKKRDSKELRNGSNKKFVYYTCELLRHESAVAYIPKAEHGPYGQEMRVLRSTSQPRDQGSICSP